MATVIVVGAGINGVTAAIELKKRGHKVVLVDPGPLPHPLAASTDISKAVRTAYGADEYYTALAERAIPLWRKWNEEFGLELYHETGVLFVRRELMRPGDFEYESCKIFEKRGHKFESRLERSRQFPKSAERLFGKRVCRTCCLCLGRDGFPPRWIVDVPLDGRVEAIFEIL